MAPLMAAALVAAPLMATGLATASRLAAANVVAATAAATAEDREKLVRLGAGRDTQHTRRQQGGHNTALHGRNSSKTGRRGETETETTDTRVAGTAGPAMHSAICGSRNQDVQRRLSTPFVLNLGVAIVELAGTALLCGRVVWNFAKLPGRLRKLFWS